MSNEASENPLNVNTILQWPFEDEKRSYTPVDCCNYARAFGAGLPGELYDSDQAFLDPQSCRVLPMMAVPLADGEFWPANPATGIHWQKMVHAGESITVHQPLSAKGTVTLQQRVEQLLDRGPERGAVMLQQLQLLYAGQPCVTIDVTMLLLANGGFGGPADQRPRQNWVPEDRPADAVVELLTPLNGLPDQRPLLELQVALDVATGDKPDQLPLRGVCSFGLAGRAAVYLLCDNHPERLRHFSVRYAGMMFTDETMRVEIWHLSPGRAALRMTAIERNALVLNHCLVEFSPD